ncbi:PRC-barrel domain-containing protein [Loktanella sp. 3ANDIMAR09]|uniref:PRC-barrel domain-containing protein n=1 Tax=Loktanella sp. 3ANDIMAR09 TaxID=1225657 RepID=UPI000700EBA8|nr:PRC-barrel domain-containing protein [Loktanella sp. 3ANDIMAR09]
MKKFLATTAIALVVSNGAFAASHEAETDTMAPAAEGTMTDEMQSGDTMMDTDSTTEMDTAEPVEDAAEETMDAAGETMDAAGETMDETMDAAEQNMEDTADNVDATMEETADDMTAMSPLDGYTQLMNADVTAEQLTDAAVFGTNDEEIGEISDLIVSDDGMIQQVVIEVGGFLGLGEKAVAVDFADVTIMQETDGDDIRASIPQTEEQLEELPEYEAEM